MESKSERALVKTLPSVNRAGCEWCEGPLDRPDLRHTSISAKYCGECIALMPIARVETALES